MLESSDQHLELCIAQLFIIYLTIKLTFLDGKIYLGVFHDYSRYIDNIIELKFIIQVLYLECQFRRSVELKMD